MPERLVESVLDGTAFAASDPVAEANHRIANNLAIIAGLIRAQVLKIPLDQPLNPLEVRTSLEQMSLRIDAVGRMHRLLMNTGHGGSIELSAYLREIADAAMCSLANIERTDILFNLETQIVVSAKQAAAIGLLVGEALINSFKHAHPPEQHGMIWLSCKRRGDDKVVVEISDDGVGLPADFDPMGAQGGSGTRLMCGLADQLNARLEFVGGNPGAAVRIDLPVPPTAMGVPRKSDQTAEMAMVVARAKLTEVILDTEAQGNGAFVASILVLKGTKLYHLAAPNLPAAYTAAIDGIEIGRAVGSCGTAAHCGHPIYVADIDTDPLWTGYPAIKRLALDAGLKACWSMPVFYSGKVLGTFAIYHREVRHPTTAERQMIRDAAASAAGLLAQIVE
jgi:two-component sensor histidine kinase